MKPSDATRTVGVWTVRVAFVAGFIYALVADKPQSTLWILGAGIAFAFCWIDEPD